MHWPPRRNVRVAATADSPRSLTLRSETTGALEAASRICQLLRKAERMQLTNQRRGVELPTPPLGPNVPGPGVARPGVVTRYYRFRCVLCFEKFENEPDLWLHESQVHSSQDRSGAPAYYCGGCPGKKCKRHFPDTKALRQHTDKLEHVLPEKFARKIRCSTLLSQS